MDRRFRTRLDEVRRDAQVPPGLLRGLQSRLEAFLRPFVVSLGRDETRENAGQYVRGLLSNLGAKTAEAIAYLHDRDRQGLQKFVGQSGWDHRPLIAELARQVGRELGEPGGVLVFDPSAFAKKGASSVGVARQWCGRLGKVENCQVGVYLAYVSGTEHALVDARLYLPKEWTRSRKRMLKAGVPSGTRFRTRHALILDLLTEHGPALPHAWIAGDDELGRCSWFREELRGRGESYLLAVPSNTAVRDRAAAPPPYRGHGRRPQVPFARADRWAAGLPAGAWEAVDVRPGEKGPLVVQVARGVVQARTEGRPSDADEVLVVVRERQPDGTWKHDYLLSNAPPETPVAEFARVLKAEHRVVDGIFDKLLKTDDTQAATRTKLLLALSQALGKHALQEEDVVYPHLRLAGIEAEAKELQAEHGDVKTYLHELEELPKDDAKWLDRVRDFHKLIQHHVKEEENEIYPRFKARLSNEDNIKLTKRMHLEGLKLA